MCTLALMLWQRMVLCAGIWVVGVCLCAQSELRVVQCYGLVVAEDSLSGLFGAHVYHKGSGRGASTDLLGFFNTPMAVGDTLYVSHRGYKTTSFVVSATSEDSYSTMVYMRQDTIQLANVDVFPYPTEAHLKRAILALDPPGTPLSLLPGEVYVEAQRRYMLNQAYLLRQRQDAWFRQNDPTYVPLTPLLLKPLWRAVRKKK